MARLGSVRVGGRSPVRLMGILNTSPESFLASSVSAGRRAARAAAARMEAAGADIIDVGGMSSAPYLRTSVPERTEMRRVLVGVRAVLDATRLPVSVDTARAAVAEAALAEGAVILNDITGLRDRAMRAVVSRRSPSVVACAHGSGGAPRDPSARALALMERARRAAVSCGAPADAVVVDPAFGFFRRSGSGALFSRAPVYWAARDLAILADLDRIAARASAPLLVSVSNKSFLGRIMGGAPAHRRLAASLAAELVAAAKGAAVIRTHDPAMTRRALGYLGARRRYSAAGP